MGIDIGRFGIWTADLDLVPSAESAEQVTALEEMGFGAVWVPEAVGREAFTNAALLLRGGTDIVVATGVASIWGRDAMAAAAAHRTVSEAYPGRFLLGLGVSHQMMVEMVRGHSYDKPLTAMRQYLDRMDAAMFMAAQPPADAPPQRVLAALGPKMLQLSAERGEGAHSYFVVPEHTAFARETLGQGPLLAVEQAVVFETDPDKARALAREHTALYCSLPNYTRNLERFGFTPDDFAHGGSDRLVDAVVAWGDIDTIRTRTLAHIDAGADHVCIQVLPMGRGTPTARWQELSDALVRG